MNRTPGLAFLFQKRDAPTTIGDRLIRLTNLTTPNMLLGAETPDRRATTRANRSLPVVLSVWEDGKPVADDAITAITKDLGRTSLSVILRQPLRAEKLVVVFWIPDEPVNHHIGAPLYTLATVIENTPLGGGFWQCGLEVDEVLLVAEYPELEKLDHLVAKLPPPELPADRG